MRQRRFLTVSLLTSLAFVGVACGDDDGGGGGGGSASSFCDTVEDFKSASDESDSIFTGTELPDAGDVEEIMTNAGDAVEEMMDNAPAEIADDVEMMGDATKRMIDAFEAADWDLMAVATDEDFAAIAEELDSEELTAASDRISAYVKDECGIDLDE